MLAKAYSGFPMGGLLGIGMLIFLAVYLGALTYVLMRSRRPYFETMAKMPLNDNLADVSTGEDQQ